MRLQLRLLGAPLVGLAMVAATAGPVVTLNEGTDIAVSVSRTGDLFAFDLADRIWVMHPGDGVARALTAAGQSNRRPAVSPDGSQVVFESYMDNNHQLQIADTDNGAATLLTLGSFDHHAPAWHPDGNRIAMASDRGGDYGIWELAVETLELSPLTFLAGDERDPAYNHDGTRLAFVADRGETDALYIREPDGQVRLLLEEKGRIHGPAWRPDDSMITYVFRSPGTSQLRMAILSDPPVVKPLTRNENVFAHPAHWMDRNQLIYTADGRIRQRELDAFSSRDIAFSAALELPDREATPPRATEFATGAQPVRGFAGYTASRDQLIVAALGDLWLLGLDGAIGRKLTHDPYADMHPALSPDGRQLAFVSDRSGRLQLWLLDLSTGDLRTVSAEPGAALYPAWRQDGGALAYLAADHPAARSSRLKVVELDSGTVTTVSASLPFRSGPTWTPGGDLTLALAARPDHATEPQAAAALLTFSASGAPVKDPLPLVFDEPRWSADGRWLAGINQAGLHIVRVEDDGNLQVPVLVAPGPVAAPRWASDHSMLWYQDSSGLMRVDPASGTPVRQSVGIDWSPAGDSTRIVIRAGKVFDGLGPGYLYAQDIVIDGNRIESVEPWRDPPPAGRFIDARQLTVLPGLMDLSARQVQPRSSTLGSNWLAWGVTTVREFASLPGDALERRESWASGQRPGPRLFLAGQLCSQPSGDATAFLNGLRAMGAGTVKLCPQLPSELQTSIIRSAHAQGLSVAGAAPFPALLLGADEIPASGSISGADRYTENFDRFAYGDVVALAGPAELTIVSRLAALGLPDLAFRSELLTRPQYLQLNGPAGRYWYEEAWRRQAGAWGTGLKAGMRTAGQSLVRALAQGARLVPGSDAPESPEGLGLHAELQLLVESGLQPFEVLRLATWDAARAVGANQDLGAVRPGRLADLVLVAGDPLEDIEAASAVQATVIDGRWYTLDDLLQGVGILYSQQTDSEANPVP